MPPRVIAIAGNALSPAGLFGIALASGGYALGWLAAAMAVQCFGMGLFQVAYFEIVTGAIPAILVVVQVLSGPRISLSRRHQPSPSRPGSSS